MDTTTAILLATYNGERYLREQIESLYAQSYKKWTIYAHDDGSTDKTIEILREYEKTKDNFIVLDYPSQKGASNNFFSLLQKVNADYYFFADQDDVWLPSKIEKCLNTMKLKECLHRDVPVIVCCDACVTDQHLNVLSHSLWKQAGTHPEFLLSFDESAATPFVTGCTMLLNMRAKECILWSKRKYATMHDAFITLCVLKVGGIVTPLYEPLIYYRQHGRNTLGAYTSESSSLLYKISHIKSIIKTDVTLLRMLRAVGYGSIFKFLKYKWIYKQKVHKIVHAH